MFAVNPTPMMDQHIRQVYNKIFGFPVMLDGIIENALFENSHKKILWILKEPYGDVPYHLKDGISDRISGKKKDSPLTWQRIALTSYCIINNITFLTSIPNWQTYGASLSQIAIINIKKTPGKSTTEMRKFRNQYKNNRSEIIDVILRQINEIKPDVVIGGGTLSIIKDDLPNIKDLKFGHFQIGQTLFLNAHHPAQRKLSLKHYAVQLSTRVSEFSTT